MGLVGGREVERRLTWDYCNGQDYDLRGTNYTAADEKLIWCRSMFGVNWISQMEIEAGTGTTQRATASNGPQNIFYVHCTALPYSSTRSRSR